MGQVGMDEQNATAAMPDMVLLSHGETHWNRARRYQGHLDSPLTITGTGQIRAIAKTLLPHLGNPSRYQVWSSPLFRTRQSVAILCEELNLSFDDVQFDDRLMERAYGRWEGLTQDEIDARHPDDVKMENADRWNFAIPGGGESFAQVSERLRDWLKSISGNRQLIVMAHGGSGRVLRGICAGLSPENIFACDYTQSTAFLISNGTTTILRAESDYLRQFGGAGAGR